jgi:hypothetical protein
MFKSERSDRAAMTVTTTTKKKSQMKLVLFVLGGAVVGYLYYRLVGCRSGTCPITSSPIISSLYGALMGFLLSRG